MPFAHIRTRNSNEMWIYWNEQKKQQRNPKCPTRNRPTGEQKTQQRKNHHKIYFEWEWIGTMDPLDARTHRQRTVYAKRYKYTSMCESIKIQIVQTCERTLFVHQLPDCLANRVPKRSRPMDASLVILSSRFAFRRLVASLRLLNLFNRIFRFRFFFLFIECAAF